MRCNEMRGLFHLYLDGELPEEQTQMIDRHVLRCQPCGGELRSLEQTRALLRESLAQEEPSPSYRERASARLLAAFSLHLRPEPAQDTSRQWTLPFQKNEF